MDFRPLLDALRHTCTLLPENDDFMIHAANQQYDGRRLTLALLNHGRSPSSIADNLWHEIVLLPNRVNKLSMLFVADGVSSLIDVTSSSGRISPAGGVTWRDAAVKFSQSKELMRIVLDWVTKVFEYVLFPIRRYRPIPSTLKSSSSTRKSNSSSRDSNVRSRVSMRVCFPLSRFS
ncbi:hypothetical protein V1517DRAFT_314574 [Lipomyces orientalis]|uniref:Uncharacterized protein n=1 Tax=Lipomyces orientalis TaxID=1233043 RepID=A0ACC3TVV4_9ASCO